MRQLVRWSLVSVLVSTLLLTAANAQGPGGPPPGPPPGPDGPGGPGMNREAMREMMDAFRMVDNYWVTLSFVMKIDDAKLIQLRSAFQEAWDARKKAGEEAREKRDRQMMVDSLKDINGTLETKLKAVLTEEEFKQLKDAAERNRPGMGGPGGPRGPGGPGGPPGGPGGPPQ